MMYILKFLQEICHINIPRTKQQKEKYAETIVELMEEYLRQDIPLSNSVRAYQSAIATEIKKGEENFADALSVSQNNVLNGKSPYITRNEKHLVSMEGFGRNNYLRKLAIIDKNKGFVKNNTRLVKRVKANLKSVLSSTGRINDLPDLVDL